MGYSLPILNWFQTRAPEVESETAILRDDRASLDSSGSKNNSNARSVYELPVNVNGQSSLRRFMLKMRPESYMKLGNSIDAEAPKLDKLLARLDQPTSREKFHAWTHGPLAYHEPGEAALRFIKRHLDAHLPTPDGEADMDALQEREHALAELIARLPDMSRSVKYSTLKLLRRYLAPQARPYEFAEVDRKTKEKLMPADGGHQRILPEAARLRLLGRLADTVSQMPEEPHMWGGKDLSKREVAEIGLHNLGDGKVSSPEGRASLLARLVALVNPIENKHSDHIIRQIRRQALNALTDIADSADMDRGHGESISALRDACLQATELFSLDEINAIRAAKHGKQ